MRLLDSQFTVIMHAASANSVLALILTPCSCILPSHEWVVKSSPHRSHCLRLIIATSEKSECFWKAALALPLCRQCVMSMVHHSPCLSQLSTLLQVAPAAQSQGVVQQTHQVS